MKIITSTQDLATFCQNLAAEPYVTIDTEFMRESTFWPKLCLVQLAGPDDAAIVDPLADDISLEPLDQLLADPTVMKVFHSARQDVEIFYHRTGTVPTPIFDTQIAAMVCGFGESVGYETLARRLANAKLDKSSRFTDWSRRPLTQRQLKYALSDVTHLRVIYSKLQSQLETSDRMHWLTEEEAVLTDPKTYSLHPEDAWARIRTRSTNPRMLGILREIAAWREVAAQRRDVPRNRIIRDEALLEIASEPPKDTEALSRIRGVSRGFAEAKIGRSLLEAIDRGRNLDDADLPVVEKPVALPSGIGPLVELLKVLLKLKCETHDVAQKLVCNASDLQLIAADDNAAVPALHGWRRQVFGEAALALKAGRLALAARGQRVELVTLADDAG